jgi:hypothetical protein
MFGLKARSKSKVHLEEHPQAQTSRWAFVRIDPSWRRLIEWPGGFRIKGFGLAECRRMWEMKLTSNYVPEHLIPPRMAQMVGPKNRQSIAIYKVGQGVGRNLFGVK